MTTGRGHRMSVYMPDAMHREVLAEAKRLNASVSWLLLRAWKLARERILAIPR